MEPQAKDAIILARSTLWTPEIDKLLRSWKFQIGKREKGHLNLARKYSRRHYFFGVPATILATVISVGTLSTFRKCDDCDDLSSPKCEADQWIRLAIGLISIFSIGLTGFQTFMNYQSESEEHKTAADEYGSLYRYLSTDVLLKPGYMRGDPVTVLQHVRSRYDDLIRHSPALGKKYDNDLSYKVLGGGSGAPRAPKPSVVPDRPSALARLLSSTTDKDEDDEDDIEKQRRASQKSSEDSWDDPSDSPRASKQSRRRMYGKGNKVTQTLIDIRESLARENDYNTSDDSHEVCLGFDLDEAACYRSPRVALSAAYHEDQVQASLRNALAFEIQRLESHAPPPQTTKLSHSREKSKQRAKPKRSLGRKKSLGKSLRKPRRGKDTPTKVDIVVDTPTESTHVSDPDE